MTKQKTNGTLLLTTLALLTALQVLLGNITQIALLGKQYNFGFLPVAAAGWLLGPLGGVIVGAVGDVIGALLFPTGSFFPGFTVTAALTGLIHGLLLQRHPAILWRTALSVVLTLLVNWLLNSLWLSILYTSRAYWGWVVYRAPSYIAEAVLQTAVVFAALKALEHTPVPKRFPKE